MSVQQTSDPGSLIAAGQDALRTGDRLRAQALFRAALRHDPDNEEALLWLSGAVEPAEALACLRRVLDLNPGNEQALEGIEWIHRNYGVIELPPATSYTDATLPLPADAPPTTPYEPIRAAGGAGGVGVAPLRSGDKPVDLQTGAYGHVAIVGALLGLLSLVVALRPNALLITRGAGNPLTWSQTVLLVVAAAVGHSLVACLAWHLLKLRAALRTAPHPLPAELGPAVFPGYLAGAVLLLALLGVGWSNQRWQAIVIAGAVLLVWAMLWSLFRIRQALVARRRDAAWPAALTRLLIWPVLAAGSGFTLVSLLVRLLLRRL